jgi:hypothetical protein
LFHLRILDHGHVVREPEELTEPAQVEETANTELTEGKPPCIPAIMLGCFFNHYFMLSMFVH